MYMFAHIHMCSTPHIWCDPQYFSYVQWWIKPFTYSE